MLAGRCTHHPDRTAVGVCISCRTAICIECSTPMAGIHRCAGCVARMGRTETAARGDAGEGHPLTWLLLLSGLVLSTLCWAGLALLLD